MRFMIAAAGLVLLAGCAADQSPAIPPDPAAPFPLANSRILGQPSPGAILVENTRPLAPSSRVARAARDWCGGDAQVSPISEDIDLIVPRSRTWIVRCR